MLKHQKAKGGWKKIKVQYAIRNLLRRHCNVTAGRIHFRGIQKVANRRNVLSAGAKKKKKVGKKERSQVWLPLVPFYGMKCPLEDSITLKLYCVL